MLISIGLEKARVRGLRSMKKLLNDFIDRYFHDEESIILVILLSAGLVILLLLECLHLRFYQQVCAHQRKR